MEPHETDEAVEWDPLYDRVIQILHAEGKVAFLPKLKPCPDCHSEWVRVFEIKPFPKPKKRKRRSKWEVRCLNCFQKSLALDSRLEAVHAWNMHSLMKGAVPVPYCDLPF